MREQVKIKEQFSKGVEIMYKNKTEMNQLYIYKSNLQFIIDTLEKSRGKIVSDGR